MLQVGEARYLVPAWMNPRPHDVSDLKRTSFLQQAKGRPRLCQSEDIRVIRTRRFGFDTRPARVRSQFANNTPSITRNTQLAPVVRPVGQPIDWRGVKSFTYEPIRVTDDRHSASIFFTLHEQSGNRRRLEARCLYGEVRMPSSGSRKYVQRCSTSVPLANGNALEIDVNPGDDKSVLGRELIRTLRAVEMISYRRH